MNVVLKAAFERDVDLVLVRCFYDNNAVAQLFLNGNDQILEIHHSAMELHGESDLLIIAQRDGKRHAILIEDKIDAPAQPNQYERYCERGERGIADGRWSGYTVFITAPHRYLESDCEARKYPHKVSFEVILDQLKTVNDPVSLAILDTALKRSEGSLPAVVDEAVTAFWEHYYDYHAQNAPHLMLCVNRCKKGPNATWPEFRTNLFKTKILHKSAQGCVDLQFRGLAEKVSQLEQLLKTYVTENMIVGKAGDSAIVRIYVPAMDFSKPFEQYESDMADVFSAVARLTNLAAALNQGNVLAPLYRGSSD